MSFRMKSKTKVNVTEEQIKKITEMNNLGTYLSSKEVTAGFYNAIYLIDTSKDELILKVAPSDDIEILTYEVDIMEREVKVYRFMNELGIPAPKIICEDNSKEIINSNYYIMEKLEGSTLFQVKDEINNRDEYIYQTMEYLAKLHTMKMDSFGYDNFDEVCTSNSDAIWKMIINIFNDGDRMNMDYPDYILKAKELVQDHIYLLDAIKTPSLLHFDLWDGNIFVQNDKVIGLIDTERSFNGEPLAEFVAMHMDIFQEDNRKFIDHYNLYANEKIVLNDETRIRFLIYQYYMYLLIYVECPYRDVEGSFDAQKAWGLDMLQKIYNELLERE